MFLSINDAELHGYLGPNVTPLLNLQTTTVENLLPLIVAQETSPGSAAKDYCHDSS